MVRLSELINQARRRASEGKNFAQNPFQMVWQSVRKYGMLAYGKLSIPTGADKKDSLAKNSSETASESGHDISFNKNVESVGENTQKPHLTTAQSVPISTADQHLASSAQALNPELTLWQPVLQPGERLQGGWWGVYTIKSCLYARDWIRCYDGLQDNGSEPVWIYEYCFDGDSWSEEDIDERKRRFKHLIDLNLRLGQGSDFRIIRPRDVISPAGNRVYLITRPLPQSLTLKDFLNEQPIPWTRLQIERFLNQVLQSLQYLQTYLVNWPGDRWEQKLSHGNLSCEHLWLRLTDNGVELNEHPFFIYLGRFSLWEQLFQPQNLPIAQGNEELGSVDDDLKALAYIVFALIQGYQSEADPTDLDLWPEDNNIRALYPYVLQLLGQGDSGRFKSIDSAVSVLRSLPETYLPSVVPDQPQETEEEEPTPERNLALPLLLLGGGILLGLATWLAWSFNPDGNRRLACSDPCRLQDVSSEGGAPLRYGIEAGSSWGKGFFSTLTSPLKQPRPNMAEFQRTLLERDPTFLLQKVHPSLVSKDLLIEDLRTGTLDAALMQKAQALPSDMERRTVGYDGIAIFVAHSDALRDDSIPKRLKGRISLQALRQVLLDPSTALDGARVKLYWPNDNVTANLLRDFLFDSDTDKVLFEQRRREEQRPTQSAFLEPERMYEQMLGDFETNAQTDKEDFIGIGFNRISQMMGQCSVYPLALVDGGRTHHLFTKADSPIDQTTDLCGDKGTYWVNHRLFEAESYPLAYEMAVVYHRPADVELCQRYETGCAKGQLLADKLLTPEGQYLLSEVGLVPVLPIQDIRQMLWSPIAAGGNP
ncbi:MAG: hypothetical protein AAGF93_04795 [Cyanobacteria bacterium P01_H01_bin.105]